MVTRKGLGSNVFSAILIVSLIFAFISAPYAAEKIVLKIGHNTPPTHGYSQAAKVFEALVESRTGGNVDVQEFHSGTLGQERDLAEAVKLGTLDMALLTPGIMSNYEPSLALISLPYVFKDWSHVDRVLEGPIGDELSERLLKKAGIRKLGWYSHGYRDIFTTKKQIVKPVDMKGLKIRVIEAPLYIGTLNALGANPTPMAWGELYTSLKTGVVDAFCNIPGNAYLFKLYEVTKYQAPVGYIWEGALIMISESKWQKLPKDVQEIVRDSAWKSGLFNRKFMEVEATTYNRLLKEKGMIQTDVDINAFRQALTPFQEEYARKIGAMDLLTKIRDAK